MEGKAGRAREVVKAYESLEQGHAGLVVPLKGWCYSWLWAQKMMCPLIRKLGTNHNKVYHNDWGHKGLSWNKSKSNPAKLDHMQHFLVSIYNWETSESEKSGLTKQVNNLSKRRTCPVLYPCMDIIDHISSSEKRKVVANFKGNWTKVF